MEKGGRLLADEDFDTDPSSLVALIVGRNAPDDMTPLLHRRGWDVRHCEGPEHVECPLLGGERCPIRDRSDAALIYVDATHVWDENAALAVVRCARHDAAPAVALIAGDTTILDPVEKMRVFRAGADLEDVADEMEDVHRDAFDD